MASSALLGPTPSVSSSTSEDKASKSNALQDVFGQPFRELVTFAIAAVILILAAWMLVSTFNTAGSSTLPAGKEAYDRQKDIMLYGLSLLGTVMGYYFGRAPAELRAKQAEKVADASQKNLAETQERLTTTSAVAL